MRNNYCKNKRILIFIIITSSLLSNILISSYLLNQNTNNNINYDSAPNSQGIVQDLYTKEWLDNPTFETPIDPWYNTTEGDISDINATTTLNQANYEVLGKKYDYEFYSDLTQDSNWTKSKNPNFPAYPDTTNINASGACVSHYWDESADQSVAVNWYRILNMPVDMSDYVITSANLTAIFNATVQATPSWDQPGDDFTGAIDVLSDSGIDPADFQASTGDYVRFYVWISDIANNSIFEVAYNQTWKLGQDSPIIDHINDTLMVTIPEDILIFYLTSVLSYNFNNFTILIGMRIWCEDNFPQDADNWKLLIIKSVSLNFTFEKKINQLTALSWNQVGNKITHKTVGSTIDIINATLNFKYKIDKNWTVLSPNSEIRVYINNRIHSETVKLSKAWSEFRDIKSGGFDVKDIVSKDDNISVSIEVYLADTFTLNETIIISIDNASLLISYTENVVEDTTSYNLFLNSIDKTLEKSIEVTMGDPVNITFIYMNQTSSQFIQNATVQLIGLGSPKDLSEDDIYNQYNITIHTSKLSLGNNFLTLSASKKYYESISILINIEVIARETELQLYLDKTDKTLDKSIQMIYGNSGNITITYKDKEILPSVHISNATVELTGLGAPKNVSEDPVLPQYTIIIDTKDLGLGNTYLTVSAEKENYTSQSIRFKIEVLERSSYIDKIFLNNTETNFIEIPWNTTLNIIMTYNDTYTNNFINNALVLLTGTRISRNFTDNSPLNYSIDINTRKLNLGINFLTISAQKDNYSLSTRIITVSVLERQTYLEIYINNSKYTASQFYNTSVGEYLNITVFYKDLDTDLFINLASVQLIESGKLYDVNESLFFDFYSITFEMEKLGAGVKFLTITAKKDNYTLSTTLITLMIEEKKTTIQLFINGTQYFDGETIEAEINDKLNVTVKYLDNVTKTFLNNATIELIGKGFLDENNILEYYNITVNVFDLEKQLNRLSIRAQLENYEYALIEFFVQVVERESMGILFLNGINKTADPYLELPIRSLLNLTVRFLDGRTREYIPGATIRIDGDLTDVLNESATLEQYYLIINTTQLNIGINVFSIIAERPNFQSYIIQNIYINIRRISTNITTVSGETTISTTPGKSITLRIVLYDLDFGGIIKGAAVTYRWQYGEADLTDPDNDGIYEAVITNVPVGSFIITIYAYSGEHYNFEPYEIVLSVIRPKENTLLWLGLLIGISIAAGILVSYLVVYMRILRFPKAVRKVRKFRKSLKRKTAPSINIINREKAFNSVYQNELNKTSSTLKIKPPVPKKKPTQQKETEITAPIKDKSVPSE